MRNFIFAITLLILSACSDTPSVPPLAEIEHISPEAVEPGDVLRIHGTGFVEGTVDLVLDGTLKPLGPRPPEHRKLRLNGTAVSETDIEIPLSSAAVRKLVDEPMIFDGHMLINFPISAKAVRIFAEKEGVHLEITPGGAGVAAQAQKTRDAEALLAALGIRLASAKEVDGLVVAEVNTDSPAESAGIEFGDRLLAVDNRALSSISDLASTALDRRHTVDIVTRQGVMKKVSTAPANATTLDADEFLAVLLSAAALGLFLAFVAPSTRRRTYVSESGPDPFTRAFGIAVISMFLCLVPAVALFLYGGAFLWILLFGAHAAGVIMVYLKAPKRRWSTLLQLVVVPVLAAAAAGLSSAVSPAEIVAAQQQDTMGANILRSPFSLLLGAVTLFVLRPSAREKEQDSFAALFAWVSAAAAASALTLSLLGGWSLLGGSLTPADGALGTALACLAFPIKTWLVIIAARKLAENTRGERRARTARRDSYLHPILLLILAGAAAAWEMPPISDSLRTAGRISAAAMFTAFLAATAGLVLKSFFVDHELRKNARRAPTAVEDVSALLPES